MSTVKFSQPTIEELLTMLPAGSSQESIKFVQSAYEFAEAAHAGRKRQSGEAYIEHDLAVAQAINDLGIDVASVAASLLHDVLLPHTGQTEKSLKKAFNHEVCALVTGLNKLLAYAASTEHQPYDGNSKSQHLEKMRRAILSIIEGDIRVILIRMADCLQDLRSAGQLGTKEQKSIASEAMSIYAPLANRLGVWQFKWELEDEAFRYLEPKLYREIVSKLAERRTERMRKIEAAAAKLRRRVQEFGLEAAVYGRSKHIYSIYNKMRRKGLDFDHIYDVQALRVILDPPDPERYASMSSKEKDEEDRYLCYQVLGIVHSLWQPIPREFDDYIASPKANGYKSLHTAVVDPETSQTIEVQIRTGRMHEAAEKGIASHWTYKEDGARISASFKRRITNMRELLNTLGDLDEELADGETLEMEVLADRIYVFTPNGDVVDMPVGSTPIDFAYQIHTQVGHRCRGARVNGKMVSLDYQLQSGEKVEIVTAKRPSPRRDWMNASLGYTGRARTRSKVRQWFREQEREQNIVQGREVVEREIRQLGLAETIKVAEIARALKYKDVDDFLARVGFGDIQSSQISGAIMLLNRDLQPDDELGPLLLHRPRAKGLTVQGLSGLQTRMAGCCSPIAPEPIVGYITRNKGVTIHSKNCAQLNAITDTERLIDVDWGTEAETHPIPIIVRAYRRQGLIDDMLAIVRGQRIHVPKTKTALENGILTVYLVAEVDSLDQLNWLLNKFENLPNVFEAQRQRWQ